MGLSHLLKSAANPLRALARSTVNQERMILSASYRASHRSVMRQCNKLAEYRKYRQQRKQSSWHTFHLERSGITNQRYLDATFKEEEISKKVYFSEEDFENDLMNIQYTYGSEKCWDCGKAYGENCEHRNFTDAELV